MANLSAKKRGSSHYSYRSWGIVYARSVASSLLETEVLACRRTTAHGSQSRQDIVPIKALGAMTERVAGRTIIEVELQSHA